MADSTSFIANVNALSKKIEVIESANSIFDEGVIPVLNEIAALNLDLAIEDLNKGTYLGNRKIDINLALNVQGITPELLKNDSQAAKDLWIANSSNIGYSSAVITFVDGTIVELPFLSDNNPTVITNSDGLLVQLSRTDMVDAVAQEDVIYSFDVLDSTTYTVEIDNIDYTYTTDAGATRGEIVTGLTNQINSGTQPWTAYSETDSIRIIADVAGNGFTASVDTNMLIRTDVESVIAGNYPTAFLEKLEDTSFNSFTLDTVSNTVRFFDVIGTSSNIEKIQLHTSPISSGYIEANPVYFWAKTTSALEALSMRTGDIIKIGNEIDNIVLLANSIEQVLEIQDRIPEFIDSYVDGVPQGDVTIHNKLAELDAIYQALSVIVEVYNDIKSDGTKYVETIATDMQGSNDIGVVATDLNLGVSSNIKLVADNSANIALVSAGMDSVNTVLANIIDVSTVATNIVNMVAVADNNANITLVGGSMGSVNTVAANIVDIGTVSDSIVSIDLLLSNLEAILNTENTLTYTYNELIGIQGQSTFGIVYEDPNTVEVFYNGRLLSKTDWNLSSGTILTLVAPVDTTGDIITVRIWNKFNILDALTVSDFYTKSEIDTQTSAMQSSIDTQTSAIQSAVDINTSAILALASGQGQIVNSSTPAFASIPKYPLTGVLDFAEVVPSTNIEVFEFDAVNNLFKMYQETTYTFMSTIEIKSNVSASRTVTFNLIDNDTEVVVLSQAQDILLASGNTESYPMSTLLVIDSPKDIRVEVTCSDTGYELRGFSSILMSSTLNVNVDNIVGTITDFEAALI